MSRSQKTDRPLNHAVLDKNRTTTYVPKRTEHEQAIARRPELYVDLDNSSNFEYISSKTQSSKPNTEQRGTVHLNLDLDLNVDFNIDPDII